MKMREEKRERQHNITKHARKWRLNLVILTPISRFS